MNCSTKDCFNYNKSKDNNCGDIYKPDEFDIQKCSEEKQKLAEELESIKEIGEIVWEGFKNKIICPFCKTEIPFYGKNKGKPFYLKIKCNGCLKNFKGYFNK